MKKWAVTTAVVFISLLIGAAVEALRRPTDAAADLIALAVLVVTGLTLILVAPRQARLSVDRQEELGLDDLIFYLYPRPGEMAAGVIPGDYLLQLHVAIANVGGRKAVLSVLRLDEFLDVRGQPVRLPDISLPIVGMKAEVRHGWVDGIRHSERWKVMPPYLLEPDDVITVELRARRGIDWSPRWDCAAVKEVAEALQSTISKARGRAI